MTTDGYLNWRAWTKNPVHYGSWICDYHRLDWMQCGCEPTTRVCFRCGETCGGKANAYDENICNCYSHQTMSSSETFCALHVASISGSSNERYPRHCTKCFKLKAVCMCGSGGWIGAAIRSKKCDKCEGFHDPTYKPFFQYGCEAHPYGSIKIGQLDLLQLQKRVIEQEEQIESFEELVAQLMVTMKQMETKLDSLTKRINGDS